MQIYFQTPAINVFKPFLEQILFHFQSIYNEFLTYSKI